MQDTDHDDDIKLNDHIDYWHNHLDRGLHHHHAEREHDYRPNGVHHHPVHITADYDPHDGGLFDCPLDHATADEPDTAA